MSAPTMVWELQRGGLFKIAGHEGVFRFDKMDGMYCIARGTNGEGLLNWSGPVERVGALDAEGRV